MTNEERLKLLAEQIKLVQDSSAAVDGLENQLSKWLNDINIFDILLRTEDELSHSNLLARLLSPKDNFGLKDLFLKEFILYVIDRADKSLLNGLTKDKVGSLNLGDAVVYREDATDLGRRIDIVIVSETEKLVFAIENKIWSTELPNQLHDYKTYLLKEYGSDYSYILVYLTPNGAQPSDNLWVSANYNFVADSLGEIIKVNNVPSKTKIYIQDYINAIRRHIVEDKELQELCEKIYNEHKDFFDIMFENTKGDKKMQAMISEHIYDLLKENEKAYKIELWDATKPSNCNWIKFTPVELQKVYGDMGAALYKGNKNLIMFDVENYKGKIISKVIVQPVGDVKHSKIRESLIEKAKGAGWEFASKESREKSIKSIEVFSAKQMNLLVESIRKGDESAWSKLDDAIQKYMTETLKEIVNVLK